MASVAALLMLFFACNCNAQFCTSNKECAAPNICKYNSCVPDPEKGYPLDGSFGNPCDSDKDCKPKFMCAANGHCMRDPLVVHVKPAVKAKCVKEEDWFQYEYHCYRYFPGKFIYEEAVKECEKHQAKLVQPDVNGLAKYINWMVKTKKGGSYYIGLKKVDNEWIWPDGSYAFNPYWRPNEPDGCCGDDVTCAMANIDGHRNVWEDVSCTKSRNAAVCEKNAV